MQLVVKVIVQLQAKSNVCIHSVYRGTCTKSIWKLTLDVKFTVKYNAPWTNLSWAILLGFHSIFTTALFLEHQSWEVFSPHTAVKPCSSIVQYFTTFRCPLTLTAGTLKVVVTYTHTKLRPTKPLGWQFSQSSQNNWRYHILPYIHPVSISFKLGISQLVINVSHYEILKPSWLGWQ